MIRIFSLAQISTVLLIGSAALAVAQQPAPPPVPASPMSTLVSDAVAAYKRSKAYIVGAAEYMPAENFSFKPTPEIRSYAELFTHVAQAQTNNCAAIGGVAAEPKPESTATGKDEVIAVLKKSFDACDAAYGSVTDANALEVAGTGSLHASKLRNMERNIAHNNEMYGQMVVYLRLKGIVPPSTAMRGRM
jgi:hypothetical protein